MVICLFFFGVGALVLTPLVCCLLVVIVICLFDKCRSVLDNVVNMIMLIRVVASASAFAVH